MVYEYSALVLLARSNWNTSKYNVFYSTKSLTIAVHVNVHCQQPFIPGTSWHYVCWAMTLCVLSCDMCAEMLHVLRCEMCGEVWDVCCCVVRCDMHAEVWDVLRRDMCAEVWHVLRCERCGEVWDVCWGVRCVMRCDVCAELWRVCWVVTCVLRCDMCAEVWHVCWVVTAWIFLPVPVLVILSVHEHKECRVKYMLPVHIFYVTVTMA